MVVEDEWGELVAYASAAGNAVAQTARQSAYLSQIRENYPKVIKTFKFEFVCDVCCVT